MKRKALTVAVVILLLILAFVWIGLQPAHAPAPAPRVNDISREQGNARHNAALEFPEANGSAPEAAAEEDKPVEGADPATTDENKAPDIDKPLGGLGVPLKIPDYRRNYTVRSTVEIRLTGRVVTEQGLPVMGATIVVDGWAIADVGPVPEGMTVSPARASFSATDVATTAHDGSFDVVVSLPMDFSDTAMAGLGVLARGTYGTSESVDYDWYEAREPEPIELVLPSKGGISGRVVDAYGVGVQYVYIRVFETGVEKPKQLKYKLSGADGAFELLDLPPGKYVIRVTSGAWVPSEDPIDCEVHPEVISELLAEIVVTPRRRIELTLMKDGKPFYGVDFVAKFILPDGAVVEQKRRAFNTGVLRLYDPPPTAVRVLITQETHQTIECQLPDMTEPALYELGTYQIRPAD